MKKRGRPKAENPKTRYIGCRVTEEEYKTLACAAGERRQKISIILHDVAIKHIYPCQPLYTIEQAERFTAELRRISNNINQIARKLNTIGASESLTEAQGMADTIKTMQKDLGRLVEAVRR